MNEWREKRDSYASYYTNKIIEQAVQKLEFQHHFDIPNPKAVEHRMGSSSRSQQGLLGQHAEIVEEEAMQCQSVSHSVSQHIVVQRGSAPPPQRRSPRHSSSANIGRGKSKRTWPLAELPLSVVFHLWLEAA